MKGFGDVYKSKKETNQRTKPSKDQIVSQAFKFHSQGNIPEAAKYYQYFINQGFEDHKVFSNFGGILMDIGRLKEAELFTRKAIELNPNYANAHLNLGTILITGGNLEEAELFIRKAIELHSDFANAHFHLGNLLRRLGKLKKAELSYLHAIKINPELASVYFSLSLMNNSDSNQVWKNKLFSESFINNKSQKDQIDIYFARANILHREKNYEESSKFLKLANQLKLTLHPSNSNILIKRSKELFVESITQEINQKKHTESPESIFIVGMPRSGSTLLESILSMNAGVDDLGECDFLEKSYVEYKKSNQALTIAERYWKKIKDYNKKQSNGTTNKNLYNYLYSGIIAKKIPNSKIIHCYRNPLDNILSIYRAHFNGNQYSSSLVDAAKVYLDQEDVMNKYKTRFRSKIYDLNYDLLVSNPAQEIKSLISWLGWKWEKIYLSPHLNKRTISTASSVQVRSPINTKSLGGWKNYKDMLRPAMEILTQTEKYKDLEY